MCLQGIGCWGCIDGRSIRDTSRFAGILFGSSLNFLLIIDKNENIEPSGVGFLTLGFIVGFFWGKTLWGGVHVGKYYVNINDI